MNQNDLNPLSDDIYYIFFSRSNNFEHLVLNYRGIIPPTSPSRLNLCLGAYFPKKALLGLLSLLYRLH